MVNRLKGAQLKLTVAGTNFSAEFSNYLYEEEEASDGVTTFADAEAGGAFRGKFSGTFIQSTDAASFWSYLWDHAGQEAAVVVMPHANTTPSADQPHLSGTVKLPGRRPTLGGDAGADEEFTADFEMFFTALPALNRGVAAVPSVTAASPASGADVGELLTLTGRNFTGTTGVTVDSGTAEFMVISDVQLVVVVPSGTTGAAPIVVTNATGAGASFDYTAAS